MHSWDVRDASEGDAGFVVGAWVAGLQSALSRKARGKALDQAGTAEELRRMVHGLRRTATVRVACDREDPDTLLGFACHEGSTLHWIYVRREARGCGVARSLVEKLELDGYTFITPPIGRVPEGWVWRPRFTFGG